jgi:predicted nucleic acid-binding protein
MGTVVLDSAVVIGLLDPLDAHHEAAAALLDRHVDDAVYLCASSYSEILVGPIRRGHEAVVEDFVTRADVGILPVDGVVAERAARLRARHDKLRLPDALALATAEIVGGRLLTFDKRLARIAT